MGSGCPVQLIKGVGCLDDDSVVGKQDTAPLEILVRARVGQLHRPENASGLIELDHPGWPHVALHRRIEGHDGQIVSESSLTRPSVVVEAMLPKRLPVGRIRAHLVIGRPRQPASCQPENGSGLVWELCLPQLFTRVEVEDSNVFGTG